MDIVNKGDKKKYAGKNLRFSIYEQVPIPEGNPGIGKGKKQLKYVSNPIHQCAEASKFDEKASGFKFPTTKLFSNQFEQTTGQSLMDRKIELHIMEVYQETPKKKKGEEDPQPITKEITIGKATVSLLDAIMYGKNSVYMIYAYDDKNKFRFRVYLKNFSIR